MERLVDGKITPAKEGEQPLSNGKIDQLLAELDHDWEVLGYQSLEKTYKFPDFQSALDFVNVVGQFAEEVDHHPTITFTWGEVTINIYTHDVGGLREEDFFWVAKVEKLYQEQ